MDNLNYNQRAGQYAFASAKEVAWHKKGQILDHTMTSKEALENAHLDYEIFKETLYTNDGLIISSHFANVRKDTNEVMGVVGKDYKIIQNTECFDFFEDVVGAGEAIFETAGALGKGEVVFMTAKLPTVMEVIKNDLVNNYIVFVTSHDGTYSITAFFSPIRVVCNNTLNAALGNCTNKVIIKHTTNAKKRMDNAAEVMGLNTQYMNTLKEAMKHLANVPISDKRAIELIARTTFSKEELKALVVNESVQVSSRKANTINQINKYYLSAKDLDGIRGTAYGLYNGITGFYQNYKEFRSDDSKMLSIIDGAAYEHQNRMFHLLTN